MRQAAEWSQHPTALYEWIGHSAQQYNCTTNLLYLFRTLFARVAGEVLWVCVRMI